MTVQSDLKVHIHTFLYGGMDYANSVVTYDAAAHAAYAATRQTVALTPRSILDATALSPITALPGGAQFALAPSLAPILPIWTAGKLAVILNAGALVEPMTKAQWTAGTKQLPPQLFAHERQQNWKQSSASEGVATGVGGRGMDYLSSQNTPNEVLSALTLAGNTPFLSGNGTVQYAMGGSGPVPLLYGAANLSGNGALFSTIKSLMTADNDHLLRKEHAKIVKRSFDTAALVTSALNSAPTITTSFATTTALAVQYKMVLKILTMSQELGIKRITFFCAMNDTTFDDHDGLATRLPVNLTNLANSQKSLWDGLGEFGLQSKTVVTTDTDFGRTYIENNGGSDHGWGGHTWVFGGNVVGKQFYGSVPVLGNDGVNDVGQGRLLPTTSSDQILATVQKRHMGLSDAQCDVATPYLANFGSTSTRYLNFL